MARKVVLAGACRTAIGTMGGALSTTPAPDLGTVVIKEALRRTGIKPEQVDEVYMGCVIQAGLGQNPARQAAVNAGIPVEVPATTINVLCGSGLHCVNLAAKLIACGCCTQCTAHGADRCTACTCQNNFSCHFSSSIPKISLLLIYYFPLFLSTVLHMRNY